MATGTAKQKNQIKKNKTKQNKTKQRGNEESLKRNLVLKKKNIERKSMLILLGTNSKCFLFKQNNKLALQCHLIS